MSPDTCRQLAAVAGETGVTVADAPVSGGRVRSTAAISLSWLVQTRQYSSVSSPF